MSNFESQITVTEVSRIQGYNHTRTRYDVRYTVYSDDPLSAESQARAAKVFRALLETDGFAGCYQRSVEKVEYVGVADRVKQPNPYNPENSYTYGVHRFVVDTYTSGSD